MLDNYTKSLNSLLPSRYNNYFITLKESHLHYTRGTKHNLFVSRVGFENYR